MTKLSGEGASRQSSNVVLITGGAGFIGSHLADHFFANDPSWIVRVLDDFSSGFEENLAGARAEIHRGSIMVDSDLRKAISGATAVIHLAAIGSVPKSIENPMVTNDVNTTGTLRVLQFAREAGVQSIIVASSSSVYGSNPSLPKSEDDWVQPMSPYAASKLAAESYALAFSHSYGLRTLAFRFFNVYGPRQTANHPYAAVVPRFISAALQGKPLVIHGDGHQTRDFTPVSAVASALYAACIGNLSYSRPINLAFGTRTSVLELAKLVLQISGSRSRIEFGARRTGDVKASQADSSNLRELIPGITPMGLTEGLEETVRWFQLKNEAI